MIIVRYVNPVHSLLDLYYDQEYRLFKLILIDRIFEAEDNKQCGDKWQTARNTEDVIVL